ncbi:MAG: hypothetical protein ACRD19_00905 [Terriglobia bacterium]
MTSKTAGMKTALEEPYASRLKDLLHFHDLATAEASLLNLDAAYREYLAAHDRAGVPAVRSIVLEGKQLAGRLAGSPRVRESKRREKREIAAWFRVWLETPDLFFEWLELRKQSQEYQELFGSSSDL